MKIFCGKKIDVDAVCQAGWKYGLLAKRRDEGKTWYRPVPEPAPTPPDDYLVTHTDGSVSVELKSVPFKALEQIVAVSDQRWEPARHRLLLTPNFVKLGRASDELLETEPIRWLVEHTRPFAETYVTLADRRGKTILHDNLCIARVGELSLKVAIEKALGDQLVSLKNEFVAFPYDRLSDVQRIVKKSGHVIKEVAAQ